MFISACGRVFWRFEVQLQTTSKAGFTVRAAGDVVIKWLMEIITEYWCPEGKPTSFRNILILWYGTMKAAPFTHLGSERHSEVGTFYTAELRTANLKTKLYRDLHIS
jgi:hypothetical protein